ncbi:MAG: lyase domain protein repeat-containing protein [Chthonomonadaceae bacterium]|nr:lyase domain protein repeat-containing protein [Chthonomonadaceae bacterium]
MDLEVEVRLRALQSGDATLRAKAAQALGRIGDAAAVPFLLETLYDPERQVREYVAEALGRISARSDPELQAALEDADAFVNEQSPQTIDGIVPPSRAILFQTLRTTQDFVLDSVIEALGRIGPVVVPDLLELLQDPDGFVRAPAAEVLGRIGDPAAVPALLNLLQDRNTHTWQCAADALGRYGFPMVPALLEALRATSSRRGAVTALGQIGDPSVTPALLQAMQSADGAFAFDCHLAFERIGPSARPYLLEALQDPYEFTRASAATALGVVGKSSDVPVLLEALQDPGRFGHVRASAAYALGALQDASAIPALLEALQNKHETVRAGAVQALGAFGEERVLSGVVKALGDSSLSVRQKALDVLAQRDSSAIPALEHALLESDQAIRVGAATALLRIYEDMDLPRRILLWPDVTPVKMAAALEALEKAHYPLPAPEVLCRDLMGDQDPTVRQVAEDILCILRPVAAPPDSRRGSRFWRWK